MRRMFEAGRREGKFLAMVENVRAGLLLRKKIVIATPDQANSIAALQPHFPAALFEIVGDWGIRIHQRRSYFPAQKGRP